MAESFEEFMAKRKERPRPQAAEAEHHVNPDAPPAESMVDRAHARDAAELEAQQGGGIMQRLGRAIKNQLHAANNSDATNGETNFWAKNLVGSKSTPADRRAAIEYLHPGATIYENPEGSSEAGGFTVAIPRADGQAPRMVSYAPPSGFVPGEGDVGKVAGETALTSAGTGAGALAGSAFGPVGTAVGGWAGGVGSAAAAPFVREAINSQLPGGSTASGGDLALEALTGAGVAAVLPPVLQYAIPGLRQLANRIAVRIPGAVGESSAKYLAETAAKSAAKKLAGNAAGQLDVRRMLDAARKLGVKPENVPASAIAGESMMPAAAREELGNALDTQVEDQAKQSVANAGEAFGKNVREAGIEARGNLRDRRAAGFEAGRENPEVKALVDARRAARKGGDQSGAGEINKQLEEMSRPSKAPPTREQLAGEYMANATERMWKQLGDTHEEQSANVREAFKADKPPQPKELTEYGSAQQDYARAQGEPSHGAAEGPIAPASIVQENIDVAAGERAPIENAIDAHSQRVADKLFSDVRDGVVKKLTPEQYKRGVTAMKDLAPHLQEQVRTAYAGKLMEGKVLGKLSDVQRQHLSDVMGKDAQDLLDIDRFLRAARGKSPKGTATNMLTEAASRALNKVPGVPTARKMGAAAKALFTDSDAVQRAWNNPKAKPQLLELLAAGRKGDSKLMETLATALSADVGAQKGQAE